MTYSTDQTTWVALKLKFGFVLPMKDAFHQPQLLKATCYAHTKS
jgi:hypothetical protein